MKHKLWLVLVCATLTACASNKVDRNQTFDVLANGIWQKAENIGRSDRDNLPDMSADALAKANQQRKQLLAELAAIDVKALSEQNQINHNILVYRLQNQVDEYTYGDRYMPLTAESGFHSDVIFMLAGSQFKTSVQFHVTWRNKPNGCARGSRKVIPSLKPF
jgi:uncharacterized protein (DUF885 family)